MHATTKQLKKCIASFEGTIIMLSHLSYVTKVIYYLAVFKYIQDKENMSKLCGTTS